MTAPQTSASAAEIVPDRPPLSEGLRIIPGGADPVTVEIPAAPAPGAAAGEDRGISAEARGALVAEIQALIPALRARARAVIWRDDVEDLVQDTIERAVRHFDRFRPGTNLRGWLYVILVHRGRDLVAHERMRRARGSNVDIDRVPAPAPEPSPPSPPAGFSRAAILSALERLKEPFREALMMRVLENRSYAEIAEKQGVPVSTAGTRIKRAREMVQATLKRERGHSGEADE